MRLLSGALVAGMGFAAVGCVTGRIEEPKYDVVARHGEMEVRAYAPRLLAETVVEGNFERAPSEGFRRIADFIFGNNKPGREVAMTAPVTQEPSVAGKWTITFTMPSSYTMDNIPRPVDGRVVLRQLPAMKYAALRFGGFNTRANVDAAIARVREAAAAQGIQLRGEPVYARYNPPWTPWFLRRNEILIEIAE